MNIINKMIITALFWFHIFLILAAVLVGFLISPWLAILMVVIHRLHIMVFKECLLSKIQRKVGGLPQDVDFLQLAAGKLFNRSITARQSKNLEYLFSSLAIIISLISYW